MSQSKGFTLIEIIVVLAIFLFVIGAVLGIFISMVENQRKALSDQQILSQVSYALEYMSKAIRMARAQTDGDANNCLGGIDNIYVMENDAYNLYESIKFINQSDVDACQKFFLDNGILKELKNSDDLSKAVALTSDNLKINFIRFAVNGVTGGATPLSSEYSGQPRVTIVLNVSMPRESFSRTIQTTVSMRNLNTNNGQR